MNERWLSNEYMGQGMMEDGWMNTLIYIKQKHNEREMYYSATLI